MSVNPDIIAYIATSINVVMLLPQVIRAWQTKHTKDLSLTTLSLFLTACILWLSYGIAKAALPIILANIVLGTMNALLISFKFRYK